MTDSERQRTHDEIRALLDAGDAPRARIAAERLASESPRDAFAHALLAHAYLLGDDALRAHRSAQHATQIDPVLADAHALSGAALLALGRLRDAITALQRAVALDPQRFTARRHLAQALLDEGRARDAVEAILPLRGVRAPSEREASEASALASRIAAIEPDSRLEVLGATPGRPSRVAVSTAAATSRTTLAAFGRDLSALARDQALDPVYGRDDEVDAVVDVLLRRQKPNPLLTGPAGVGKTAIVEGLAQRVARAAIPDRLRGMRLVEISVAALVAGTSYRGELEARLRALLDEARTDPSLVLVVDEIHTLVGAGGMGSELDASEMLKPALARGELRVIGATTDADYERVIARDPTLSRRFTRIAVAEPDAATATTIARAVAHDLAAFHRVQFDEAVPHEAVALALRHIPARRLPDKAIDLLDQSAVIATRAGRAVVTRDDLHVAVARLASVPLAAVREPLAAYADLEARLATSVFGQRDACAHIAERALVHAMRENATRPLAFVFAGPAGSGKTHAARILADALHVPCVTVDLGDLGEGHDLARLAGAPAGYLGHDEPSPMVRALRTSPAAVLVLEDFDRAHARVLASITRWIEAGEMTDARGERVDLRHATLVLTTTTAEKRGAVGFGRDPSTDRGAHDLERTLSPSLRTVVDEIVTFRELDDRSLLTIAERALSVTVDAWKSAGREFSIAPDGVRQIVSVSGACDARSVIAAVEREIVAPAASAFARGAGAVHATWNGARIVVARAAKRVPIGRVRGK